MKLLSYVFPFSLFLPHAEAHHSPLLPRAQFEPFHARWQRWVCMITHRRCWQDLCCADGNVAQGDAEEGWPVCLGEGCGLGDVEILCSADTDQAAQRG